MKTAPDLDVMPFPCVAAYRNQTFVFINYIRLIFETLSSSKKALQHMGEGSFKFAVKSRKYRDYISMIKAA